MPGAARSAKLEFGVATEADAAELVVLRLAAGAHLTATFGRGHWSGGFTERGALRAIKTGRVLFARRGRGIVGTLQLSTRKPWAIDASYFTAVKRPLYLVGMAVSPERQRQGVGRALLTHAHGVAREWPCEAVRLDAYDAEAGAGGFYASCGYREVGRASYRGVPLIYYEWLL